MKYNNSTLFILQYFFNKGKDFSLEIWYNNDWLYHNIFCQWTLTSLSYLETGVCDIVAGYVDCNNANNRFSILPVTYLKSAVKITAGTGSLTDPFILSFKC